MKSTTGGVAETSSEGSAAITRNGAMTAAVEGTTGPNAGVIIETMTSGGVGATAIVQQDMT